MNASNKLKQESTILYSNTAPFYTTVPLWENIQSIKTRIQGNANEIILANYILNSSYVHLPQKTLLYLSSLTYKESECIRILEYILNILKVKLYTWKTMYKGLYTLSYLNVYGSETFKNLISTYEWRFHELINELETEDMRLKSLHNQRMKRVTASGEMKGPVHVDKSNSLSSIVPTTNLDRFDVKCKLNSEVNKSTIWHSVMHSDSPINSLYDNMDHIVVRSKSGAIISNEGILLCHCEVNDLLRHLKDTELADEVRKSFNNNKFNNKSSCKEDNLKER